MKERSHRLIVKKEIQKDAKKLLTKLNQSAYLSVSNVDVKSVRPISKQDVSKIASDLFDVYEEPRQIPKDYRNIKTQLITRLKGMLSKDDYYAKLCWTRKTDIRKKDLPQKKRKGKAGISIEDLSHSESYMIYNQSKGKVVFDSIASISSSVLTKQPISPTRAVRTFTAGRRLSVPIVNPVVDYIGETKSWWTMFSFNNYYRDFKGNVFHTHLRDVKEIDEMVHDILSFIGDLPIPYARMITQILRFNLYMAKNSDSTFDIFSYSGIKRTWLIPEIWWIAIPIVYTAFVSNIPLHPPVRISIIQPGVIGIFPIMSLILGYYIKWLSEEIRYYPSPTTYPQHFIANINPNSREIHTNQCTWVRKMAKDNKVRYDRLWKALTQTYGFDGCYYCLNFWHRG